MPSYKGIELITPFEELEPQLETIALAPKFQQFLDRIVAPDSNIYCENVRVDSVDWFGPVQPERLGFVKVTAKAFNKTTGKPLNAIAFVRGGSVAVLIRVQVEDKSYFLVAEQMRFPVGGKRVEAVAGMVDAFTNCIHGVAAKEVYEETGLIIPSVDTLVDLGTIEPSMGGCNEVVSLFAWDTSVSKVQFEQMKQTTYGEGNEEIQLKFWEEDDKLMDKIIGTKDPKLECAYNRYMWNLRKRAI